MTNSTPQHLILSWNAKKPGAARLTLNGRAQDPVAITAAERAALRTPVSGSFEFDAMRQTCKRISISKGRRIPHTKRYQSINGIPMAVEMWAVSNPSEGIGLHEPASVLFQGQSGYFEFELKASRLDAPRLKVSGGKNPITLVPEPEVTSKAGLIRVRQEFRVAPNARPGYYSFEMRAAADGRKARLRYFVEVLRLHRFEQRHTHVKTSVRSGTLRMESILDAENARGIRECITWRGEIQYRVSPGAIFLRVSNREMTAALRVPTGLKTSPGPLRPNGVLGLNGIEGALKTRADESEDDDEDLDEWLKTGLELLSSAVATAGGVAGAGVVKAAIAIALQSLGPWIGVPATLILYSPVVEAKWGAIMAFAAGEAGWALNEKLGEILFDG